MEPPSQDYAYTNPTFVFGTAMEETARNQYECNQKPKIEFQQKFGSSPERRGSIPLITIDKVADPHGINNESSQGDKFTSSALNKSSTLGFLGKPAGKKTLHAAPKANGEGIHCQQTFVRPGSRERSVSASHSLPLPSSIPSSTDQPSHNSFTPLMFQRAVSLRGSSSRRIKFEIPGGSGTSRKSEGKKEVSLRRTFSDRTTEKSLTRSNSTKYSSYFENRNSRLNVENAETNNEKASLGLKAEHRNSFDISEFLIDNVCSPANPFLLREPSKEMIDAVHYFINDLEAYERSLEDLVKVYDEMKRRSPEKIRQYFDLPFILIISMLELQKEMNAKLRTSKEKIKVIAEEFSKERLVIYKQYMILSPNILNGIDKNKMHIQVNYPKLKSLMIAPARRLNVFVNYIQGLLKYTSDENYPLLQKAIENLEEIKRSADTEMTIKIVRDCPFDLHLAGKICHVGDLSYVSGPLASKVYYLILLENMLVLTLSKISHLIYVTHFRIQQLVSIKRNLETRLMITVTTSPHGGKENHTFKNSSSSSIEKWFASLEKVLSEKKASYEICNESHLSQTSLNASGKCIPLSLFHVFPFLRRLKTDCCEEASEDKSFCIEEHCRKLIRKEESYVIKMNSLLEPDTLPPPKDLEILIKRILTLHEVFLLPEMRQARKRNHHCVITGFMEFLERLSDYQTYMIKRAIYTIALPDGVRAHHFVLPVRQLASYVKWAKKLRYEAEYKSYSKYAVDVLLSYITEAKVRLLHEAIPKCCIDFFRTGEVKKAGTLYISSKLKNKVIRDGVYLILLFEKIILITKAQSPTYKLYLDIWLDQANIGPPCDSKSAFRLEYRQGGFKSPFTLEFKAENKELKASWVNSISEELRNLAEEVKEASRSSLV